jgi:hypothetical protein
MQHNTKLSYAEEGSRAEMIGSRTARLQPASAGHRDTIILLGNFCVICANYEAFAYASANSS